MVGYQAIEDKIKAKFIDKYPDELSADLVQQGEMDRLFENMLATGSHYGVYLHFNGGTLRNRQPFNKLVWTWSTTGIFFIRYSEDIETEMRSVVGTLAALVDGDHTLGGVTPLAHVVDIGDAEPGTMNDVPYYWVPFVIECIDRD